jgi:hypothetical protein
LLALGARLARFRATARSTAAPSAARGVAPPCARPAPTGVSSHAVAPHAVTWPALAAAAAFPIARRESQAFSRAATGSGFK